MWLLGRIPIKRNCGYVKLASVVVVFIAVKKKSKKLHYLDYVKVCPT